MAVTNKGTRAVVWIIVGLLIVGLMGFSVTNFGGNVTSIGRVGDREIGAQRYYTALQNRLSMLSQQSGQNFTFAQAQLFGVDQQTLQELVTTVAIEDEANSLGLSVGDDEVRAELLRIPAFQGLDGNFDREAYASALRRSNLNERQFEADLRAEISRTLLQGSVLSGVQTPDVYLDTIVSYVGERRNFVWASLTVDDLADPIGDPTDEDLRAYFEANEDDFMLPETRKITYAWITPEMIVDTIDVDEATARELYDERIEEFVTPARRLVERLVLGAEADAAKARLDNGEITFDDLVAERGLELANIDLGDVTQDELGAAGEGIFASEELGVYGPFDSDFGPALFRVNAVLAATETTFDDAKAELTRELALDEARILIDAQIDEVDDLLAGGATLEELAAETELELATVDWFPGAGGGIADYANFGREAVALEIGDFAEVIQLDDGGIFAMRLDEVIDPRLDEFDNAKPQAETGWRRDATVAALTAQAETIAEALRAGTDSTELGVTLVEQTDITRQSFVPEASVDFLEEVFKLDAGTVQVIPADTFVQIVRLDEILPADSENEELSASREALDTNTARALGNDILSAYAAAIQAQAGINLDQGAINAIHTQIP